MTVNTRISLLIDGLIVATMTTSSSVKPKCSVLKDAQAAGAPTMEQHLVQIAKLFQRLNSQAKVN